LSCDNTSAIIAEIIIWNKADYCLRRYVGSVIKAGVIGVGLMGENHARVYSQLPNVELVGVADIDKGKATSVARSHSCKAYADYHDLLDMNPQALSIAVPTTLHQEVASDAIQKGINILVEKPIADTLEDANKLIEAARQKQIKLMVGHIERFNPAIIKLKELIDNGLLGNIISISAKRVGPYNSRIKDVGVLVDIGTHDIDIMSYLYGEPVKEVYASAGSVVHEYEDHAIVMLNFSKGRSGVIETNWLTPHKVRTLTVIGSKGYAEVNYTESSLSISDREWIREAKINKEEPLKLELEHFVDCIRHDKDPLVSGEVGRQALQVALEAVASYRTRKVRVIK
jgi:UDP-N-acetylglucosamine 3-dehydrogenase